MYINECLSRFEAKTGHRPKRNGDGYLTCCPAHDDQNPSLSIKEASDGTILLHCHAGCSPKEVCESIDSTLSDLFQKKLTTPLRIEYPYCDEKGTTLFTKVRLEPGLNGKPKSFHWERCDVDGNIIKNLKGCPKTLYRLPGLLEGIDNENTIFLVEGEKDADRLVKGGLTATTTQESLYWSNEFTEILKDADVVILYDMDKTGYDRRDLLCKELYGKVRRLRVVDLPGLVYTESHGQDVSDWLMGGHTIGELLEISASTPDYLSKPQQRLKVVSLNDFLEMYFPPRENILSPFLPEQGMCMIYAKRGVGKTHIALGIAYAVATGSLFLKWTASKPRKVLYIDGEMPATVMQERLKRLSLMSDIPLPETDHFRLITPDLQDGSLPDLSTKGGQILLEEALGDSVLLILDNVSSLFRSVEENDADSWQEIQDWLLSLRRKGKSVLLVHHAGKSGAQRGSSKKEDVLDAVMVLKHAQGYQQQQGASFDVIFEKTRHFTGKEAEPFHAEIKEIEDGLWIWEVSEPTIDDEIIAVANAVKEGLSIKEITEKTSLSKSQIETRKAKAKQLGLL
ncbi:MAG: AAA family ATPase [Simkaniaceae bacterium]|nr:AAA family ATPase [Simkaniaceae bacterium]